MSFPSLSLSSIIALKLLSPFPWQDYVADPDRRRVRDSNSSPLRRDGNGGYLMFIDEKKGSVPNKVSWMISSYILG